MHFAFALPSLVSSYSLYLAAAASSVHHRSYLTDFITFGTIQSLPVFSLVVNLAHYLNDLFLSVLTSLLFDLTHLFNSFEYCCTARLRLSINTSFSVVPPLCARWRSRMTRGRPLELIVSLLVLSKSPYSFVINLLVVNLVPLNSLPRHSRSQSVVFRLSSN